MSEPKKTEAKAPEFKPVELDPASTRGAIAGAVVGAVMGFAYGSIPKITTLDIGPLPGELVGVVAGAIGGGFLGAFAGAVGKKLMTPRAAAGAAIAFAVIVLGRLADDTGKLDADGKPIYDWLIDIIVAGTFWGVIGAIVGAVLLEPEKPGESAASSEAKGAKEA